MENTKQSMLSAGANEIGAHYVFIGCPICASGCAEPAEWWFLRVMSAVRPIQRLSSIA